MDFEGSGSSGGHAPGRGTTRRMTDSRRAAHEVVHKAVRDLIVELRAHSFTAATLQEVFGGELLEPCALWGEKAVSLAFDIASYISLQDADAEAWGRRAATEATRDSGEGIKAAVKIGQYLLGPSPLTLANDISKMAGEALENINKARLLHRVAELTQALKALEDLQALEKPFDAVLSVDRGVSYTLDQFAELALASSIELSQPAAEEIPSPDPLTPR